MTLAAPAEASKPCFFLLLIRSLCRWHCSFRFFLADSLARYRCCAFHLDHAKAARRHAGLQYRCSAC